MNMLFTRILNSLRDLVCPVNGDQEAPSVDGCERPRIRKPDKHPIFRD